MPVASVSEVKQLSPLFRNETNMRINLFMGIAERCIDECTWGDKYREGVLLLTAHYLTRSHDQLGSAEESCDDGLSGSGDSGSSDSGTLLANSSTSNSSTTETTFTPETYVRKKTVGNVSIEYDLIDRGNSTTTTSGNSNQAGGGSAGGAGGESDDDLSLTFWGKLFLDIKKNIVCLPVVASGRRNSWPR